MNPAIAGVVLAGGRGRRMAADGEKVLNRLGARTLLERAVERARTQVPLLVLSSHLPASRLPVQGCPVLGDPIPDRPGPLAGVLAAMEYVQREHRDIAWLASFAADTPWYPEDLVARLVAARQDAGADIAVAASKGRCHHVFALWPVTLARALREALVLHGERRVEGFQGRYRVVAVDWSAQPFDPFFNINTPDDLAQARAMLEGPQRQD